MAPVETPDLNGAFPRLGDEQIAALSTRGERRRTRAGEVLYREGEPVSDFIVVLEGLVAIVEGDGERELAVHGPGRFLGEVNLLTGQAAFLTAVVREAGAVLVVPLERLREAVAQDARLGDLIVQAYLIRRSLLIELGSGFRIVGSRYRPGHAPAARVRRAQPPPSPLARPGAATRRPRRCCASWASVRRTRRW